MLITKKTFISILLNCFIVAGFTQETSVIKNSMVQQFYAINNQKLYWFESSKKMARAIEWLTVIDKTNTQEAQLQNNLIKSELYGIKTMDSLHIAITDRQITELVLNFIKELQEIKVLFDYDEISVSRDYIYINQLKQDNVNEPVVNWITQLECKDYEYTLLKKYLTDSITPKEIFKYKAVQQAMEYRRYISLYHEKEYIVVNIAAADAEYYRNDTLKLKMLTVVGKPSKPTPTIASYITSIVTNPYWHVPRSIATKEILPAVQKNDNYLEQHNFDVVDANGTIIDNDNLNWNEYNAKNFPYFFRQSTGVENALGVLKFNLQNPFSIFLHATSWNGVFAKDYRFLSHGCVRLEKPFALANVLLKSNLDSKTMKNNKNNQPKTTLLPTKIATFIIYNVAIVVNNKVVFLNDVYHSINK